jgi:HIV Tat-specific factor 1
MSAIYTVESRNPVSTAVYRMHDASRSAAMDEVRHWWYVDVDGAAAGPASVAELVTLFAGGAIDGMTPVLLSLSNNSKPSVNTDDANWIPLANVPALRAAAAAAAAVDDADEEEESTNDKHGTNDEHGTDSKNKDEIEPAAVDSNGDGVHDRLVAYQLPSPSAMIPPESEPLSDPLPRPLLSDDPSMAVAILNPTSSSGSGPDPTRAADLAATKISRKRSREVTRGRDRFRRSVYVTGVPSDATEREVADHFAKCGILMPDARTGRASLKLYTDANGRPQGDALITYAMEASVDNAELILDGVSLRDGGDDMAVRRATFDEARALRGKKERERPGLEGRATGGGDASKSDKHRRKAACASSKMKGAGQTVVREALGWQDEDDDLAARRRTAVRIVVLLNVFDGSVPGVDYAGIQADMEEGLGACGVVERVVVFERSLDGAVLGRFRDGIGARRTIDIMHGRWYDGRKISAEYYDGVTDYRVGEREEDREEREIAWEEWLGGDDHGDVGRCSE